jgi:hypothetical protein
VRRALLLLLLCCSCDDDESTVDAGCHTAACYQVNDAGLDAR